MIDIADVHEFLLVRIDADGNNPYIVSEEKELDVAINIAKSFQLNAGGQYRYRVYQLIGSSHFEVSFKDGENNAM